MGKLNASRLPRVVIPRLSALPVSALDTDWGVSFAVNQFHSASSFHRPITTVRVAHDGKCIIFYWHVKEDVVLAAIADVNGPTHCDSCVEVFLGPSQGNYYFSIEINAAGVPFVALIRDSRRRGDWFWDAELIDVAIVNRYLKIVSSLTGPIIPERREPCSWTLCLTVDADFFAHVLGRPVVLNGEWFGNFYKCADCSSLPHWGSWSPIGDVLNFHQPECFGLLLFS